LEKASGSNLGKKSQPSAGKDGKQPPGSIQDSSGLHKTRPREKMIDPNNIISLPRHIDLAKLTSLRDDDPMLGEIRANVVSEFLRMHSINQSQIDSQDKDKLDKLTHDNFNLIGNSLSIGSDGQTQLDINEVS
jgi:hypothetical protein